jgi:hypothetical protein
MLGVIRSRLMDSGEIVVCGVDRNHGSVILNFLAKSVRQREKSSYPILMDRLCRST